tara:strand:- start:652 stop:837 length:186 start_codon:yes stop_codon:yes gene_type:complete
MAQQMEPIIGLVTGDELIHCSLCAGSAWADEKIMKTTQGGNHVCPTCYEILHYGELNGSKS